METNREVATSKDHATPMIDEVEPPNNPEMALIMARHSREAMVALRTITETRAVVIEAVPAKELTETEADITEVDKATKAHEIRDQITHHETTFTNNTNQHKSPK